MKTEKFSLNSLIKRVMGTIENPDTETKTGAETETVDETEGEADKTEGEADKKETETADPETQEPKADAEAPKADGKSASIEGQVSMSIAEFTGLSALATETETLRADNSKLKIKADNWDSYKAALDSSHSDADTSGSESGKDADKSKDEHADLRKKHGALMVGL